MSTSIERPPSWTRIASPCPTSRTLTTARRGGAGPRESIIDPHTAAATNRRPAVEERGSGHHTHSSVAMPRTRADAYHPQSKATAAPGNEASNPASHDAAPSTADAAFIAAHPSSGSTIPSTAPPNPSSSASETSGPAIAFASGASTEKMPNEVATTGTVATCAASVSDNGSTSPRKRAGNAELTQAVESSPKRSSAPTASTESCNPMSKTDQGSSTSTATTATASDATP